MQMQTRQLVSTGSPYEPIIGISRAVRVGSIVTISGTAPLGRDGKTVGVGNPADQARRCIEIAKEALEKLDVSLSNVVRTRILLTRIEDWEEVARVHGEYFGIIRPSCTVMQICRFVDSEWLVEMEFDAVV